MLECPKVKDINFVGEYPGLVKSGGGYVWDDVLGYRVWCHPLDGAPNDDEDDSDYYYAFENYDAPEFSKNNPGSEDPIALILQEEYIDEPEPGKYILCKRKTDNGMAY